jgi:hypothetical protein
MPRFQPSLRTALDDAPAPLTNAPESVLADQLDAARRIVAGVQANPPRTPLDDPAVSEEFQRIRWFPLPSEGQEHLRPRTYEKATNRSPRRTRWPEATMRSSPAWP